VQAMGPRRVFVLSLALLRAALSDTSAEVQACIAGIPRKLLFPSSTLLCIDVHLVPPHTVEACRLCSHNPVQGML
jgi:hypothetical protein